MARSIMCHNDLDEELNSSEGKTNAKADNLKAG